MVREKKIRRPVRNKFIHLRADEETYTLVRQTVQELKEMVPKAAALNINVPTQGNSGKGHSCDIIREALLLYKKSLSRTIEREEAKNNDKKRIQLHGSILPKL